MTYTITAVNENHVIYKKATVSCEDTAEMIATAWAALGFKILRAAEG